MKKEEKKKIDVVNLTDGAKKEWRILEKAVLDSELPLFQYWEKHKLGIANERGWECNGTCAGEERVNENCVKSCTDGACRQRECQTLNTYDRFMQRLKKHLTEPVSQVTYYEIRRALRIVQQEGGRRGPYQASTMKGYFSCLCDIYSYAQKQGHANNLLALYKTKKNRLGKDIYDLIDPTKADDEILMDLEEFGEKLREKARSLTIWQTEQLIRLVREGIPEDGRYLAIALILYAGVRPAEMRGLFWGDIKPFVDHPDRFFLNLCKIRNKKGRMTYRMKTENAYRKVPIHQELAVLLELRRDVVEKHWGKPIDNLPICCRGNQLNQHCKDFEVANLTDELFKKISLKGEGLIPFLVERESRLLSRKLKKGKSTGGEEDEEEAGELSLYVLRRHFWTWMESSTQTTDFEKRYVMGHAMLIDKKSMRRRYNDEHILWKICEKMDRCAQCRDLHRSMISSQLEGDKPLLLANRGVYLIELPEELLLEGGTVYIDAITEEQGDAVILEVLSGRSAIGKPEGKVQSWPISNRKIDGINCEYENWQAHKRPISPYIKKKGRGEVSEEVDLPAEAEELQEE